MVKDGLGWLRIDNDSGQVCSIRNVVLFVVLNECWLDLDEVGDVNDRIEMVHLGKSHQERGRQATVPYTTVAAHLKTHHVTMGSVGCSHPPV